VAQLIFSIYLILIIEEHRPPIGSKGKKNREYLIIIKYSRFKYFGFILVDRQKAARRFHTYRISLAIP
jgi:hypothetical protein